MISASIVLYQPEIDMLQKTIECFLATPLLKKLYLIDNSPNKLSLPIFNDISIEYLFSGQNLGFGQGHNQILNKITSDYHLILNPDVEFSPSVIPNLIQEFENHKNLACITPKVLNSDLSMQYVCRRYPSIFDLLNRRIPFSRARNRFNEYRNLNLDLTFSPDWFHGCFMLFRTDDLKAIQGFDERYFLYMEDVDICKKIDAIGKGKQYFPDQQVIHHHQKASSKNLKLFFIHVQSVIRYFLKWQF